MKMQAEGLYFFIKVRKMLSIRVFGMHDFRRTCFHFRGNSSTDFRPLSYEDIFLLPHKSAAPMISNLIFGN